MSDPAGGPADPWRLATHAGLREHQRQQWAGRSFAERLQAVEDLAELARSLRPLAGPPTTAADFGVAAPGRLDKERGAGSL